MSVPERVQHLLPSIVFVGAHMESRAPFTFLIEHGYNLSGLVTLETECLQKMSGAVDLSEAAKRTRIPILRVKNINESHAITWISEKAPDILLVIGWTQLLKPELLRKPKFACFGFHASLLPKYRGRAPVNWAIINGETVTGNTMLVLEPEADSGDIVAQRTIPITDDDDCRTIYEKVGQTEVDMLAEILPMLQQGIFPRRKQDDSQSTVMPKRHPEDGRIDWHRATREVYNWIRALTDPYPGAFSVLDGHRVWIWAAREDNALANRNRFKPGDVIQNAQGWPLVATGDGWIRVLEAQREGGPKVSGTIAANSFLIAGSSFAGESKALS